MACVRDASVLGERAKLAFSRLGQTPAGPGPLVSRKPYDRSRQLFDATALRGYDRNHRHAQSMGQSLNVDLYLGALGQVDHRQRDDQRSPVLKKLCRQIKVAFDVGRINDRDDEVWRGQALDLSRQNIARDLFIERCGVETVEAG